jgi:ribosomal protein L23
MKTTMKQTDNNTSVLTVDVKINKHQLTQAEKKLCGIGVAKVNTLIWRDVQQKAYVQLASALHVVSKIGIR